MQKTLIMMRHAKTNVQGTGQSDFDRTLTNRGTRNAKEMGERLRNNKLMPDLIIASPAMRTTQTAQLVAEALGYDKEKIKWEKKLYHCSPAIFEEVIYEADDALNTIMIIAHNPGTTDFVNGLSPAFDTDDMPTGAIAAVHIDIQRWTDFSSAKKEVFLYTYPKEVL